jgi:BMFP domain-containing protein YqiC
VSDVIWETFDGLFKTLHRHGRRVEELEQRVVELERRLQERAATLAPHAEAVERVTQMPAEKAA